MGKIDHKGMCILCQNLPLSKAHTPKHTYMKRVTQAENCGAQGIQSLFCCTVCQTYWLYQQDKWESCLGFKLWSGDLNDYLSSTRNSVGTWSAANAHRHSLKELGKRPLH